MAAFEPFSPKSLGLKPTNYRFNKADIARIERLLTERVQHFDEVSDYKSSRPYVNTLIKVQHILAGKKQVLKWKTGKL